MKDRPDQGSTYVPGFGYVDTKAVEAVLKSIPDTKLLDMGRAYLAQACSGTAQGAVTAMRSALEAPR